MDYDREHCRALAEAARELVKARLWEAMGDEEGIALKVAGEAHPYLAMVMGSSGMENGLAIYCGPRGLETLRRLYTNPGDEDLLEEIEQIGYSMTPFREIRSGSRRLLSFMGITRNRRGGVPYFITKRPGAVPRDPNPEEVRVQLLILKAILIAHDLGELVTFSLFDEGPLPCLSVEGDVLGATVRVERLECSSATAESPGGLAAPPRVDVGATAGRWLAGMPSLPMSIVEDERSVRVLFVMDRKSMELLSLQPIMSGDWDEAAAQLNAVIQERGLPEELTFSSRRLFNHVAPGLEALGARCIFQEEVPEIEALMNMLKASMAGGLPSFEEFFAAFSEDEEDDWDFEDLDIDELEPELPRSLREWKEVDHRVIEKTARGIEEEELDSAAMLKRFFGDLKAARFFEASPRAMSVYPTFWSWLAEYRRAGKKSGSLLERVRADFEDDARALSLIRSRLEAPPSLYRITDVDVGASVCLLDLLTGEEWLIQDQLLSEHVVRDMCLAAKVYAAGPYRFCLPLSPGLTPQDAQDGFAFLREQGLEFSHGGMRKQAHLFGRLWSWLKERRSRAKTKKSGVYDFAFLVPGDARGSARSWAERPLPALGGASPRQGAKAPEQRGFLLALIRAMPDIPALEGEPDLRDLMLKELGLG